MDRFSAKQSKLPKVVRVITHPAFIILSVTVLLLAKAISYGRLVYGDIPLFDVPLSRVNYLYIWGAEQLGTSVRQGFNTMRDQLLLLIAPNSYSYYFLKYILPIMLVPLVYYWVLKKLGVHRRAALIIGSIFPLFTPIVFGDFLTGQTFWIYLTLPFVFYFTVQIFCLRKFKLRNYLLLALFLFLSLGALPPIIVPLLVALALIVSVAFLLNMSIYNKKLVLQYTVAGLVVGVVFLVLAFPYLLAAPSGQAAYTPESLLGDYFHNYSGTTLDNTLRLAGNNGNGQNTLGYNVPSISNLVGYLLIGIIFYGVMFLRPREGGRRYSLLTTLLAILLGVFGFMHVMSTDALFGSQLFQSQWIVSTIRNPSKLYLLVLPVVTLMFAFAIENYIEHARSKSQRQAVVLIALALMAVYGWPALRGDLGLLFNREDKLASYKSDPLVQDIVREVPTRNRSLLLPANHQDELNYQNINPGFNVLRLEGGMPGTTQLLRQMKQTLSSRDGYFFNYLNASGIRHVFAKKDPAAYEDSLFDLFSVTLTPKQTHDFLASRLTQAQNQPEFWQFANPSANPLIYSPQTITHFENTSDLKNKAPFLTHKSAVIDGQLSPDQASFTTTQRVKSDLKDNELIESGKAQLYDPQILLVNLYARGVGEQRQLVFEILDPLTQQIDRTITHPISPDASVITLGSDTYSFGDQQKTVTMRAGSHQFKSARLAPADITAADPSFETQAPAAHDATPTQPGKADLSARHHADATDGHTSLQITSKNHTAFGVKHLVTTDLKQDYLLQFDYKTPRGAPPRFAILQDDKTLLPAGGQQTRHTDWQTAEAYFSTQRADSPEAVKLFFYTTPDNNRPTENLFDNIRLFALDQKDRFELELPSYPPDYDLLNYHYQAPEQSAHNLVSNGSFEDDRLWGEAQDATAGATGEPDIKASASDDAAQGERSLKLESKDHTAYVSKKASHYLPNTVYKLSFSYKHISGRNPAFAIWQGGKGLSRPAGNLKSESDGWNYFETYFVPDAQATDLSVYLYSPSIGDHTVNLFDDVRLEPSSLVSSYLIKKSDPKQQPADLVQSFERINPTMAKVQLKAGKGMVVFNESYHKGWQGYVVPAGYQPTTAEKLMISQPPGQKVDDHVLVNGFANGWWIDSHDYNIPPNGTYEILLLYTPQRAMSVGLLVSGGGLLIMGGYLVYDVRRNYETYVSRRTRR